MIKKVVKKTSVKVAVPKTLTDKLLVAVHKILIENKSELTDKIQKVVDESIKKIVKKSDKQIKKALKNK